MVHGHGTRGGGGGRVTKEICRSDHFGGCRPRPSISDVFRPIAGTEHLPQLWPAVTGDAGKMWRPWPSAALHIALAVRAFTCPAGAIPLMTIKAWVCSLAWGSCPGLRFCRAVLKSSSRLCGSQCRMCRPIRVGVALPGRQQVLRPALSLQKLNYGSGFRTCCD